MVAMRLEGPSESSDNHGAERAVFRARKVQRFTSREGITGTAADQLRLARNINRSLTRQLASPMESSQPRQERPANVFEVREPAGDRLVAQITPKLFPATLQVAAPSHGEVSHVPVLARFFPAHTVHARRSTAVVTGDHCELKSTDHYHVHRVSISLEPLTKAGSPGRAALRELLKNPTEGGIAQFQQSMRRIANPPEHRDTRATVPVQAHHRTLVTSSENVQQGYGSRMTVKTHYVVEESQLPIVDLLARDSSLVRSLVAAVNEPRPGPDTRKFLRSAAGSAGRTSELALLDHCTGLSQRDTAIYWLFGVDVVDRAAAVMVGSRNRLRTSMQVHRGALAPGRILADLDQARKQAALDRESRAASPQRSGPGRFIAPGDPRSEPNRLLFPRGRTTGWEPRGGFGGGIGPGR
jgi:hypothetical protein